jgi:hypothetical protein
MTGFYFGLKDSLHEYEIDLLRQRLLAAHRKPEPQVFDFVLDLD